MPTEAQMNAVINEIVETPGPRWPGQTYEDGVRATLDWVLGFEDHPPLWDK